MNFFILSACIIALVIGVSSQPTQAPGRCPVAVDDAVLHLYRICMLNFEIRGENRNMTADASNRKVSECFVQQIRASGALSNFDTGCSDKSDNALRRACIADKIELLFAVNPSINNNQRTITLIYTLYELNILMITATVPECSYETTDEYQIPSTADIV